MPIIRVPFDAFKEVEKKLKYRFWDKERERSNRAAFIADNARGSKRRCPFRHQRLAWSGPPHDPIQCKICLDCGAVASEPEIRDRGYDFDLCPDWIIQEIMDLDLQRQAELGNKAFFGGLGGRPNA